MDTLTTLSRSPIEVIASRRTRLPSHQIDGAPVRRWAAAVFTAEVDHMVSEFWNIAAQCRYDFDRYELPALPNRAAWPHELTAARGLNALSHMQTAERQASEFWNGPNYVRTARRRWIAAARVFLNAVKQYQREVL